MPNVYISLGVHDFFRDAPTTLLILQCSRLNICFYNFIMFTLNPANIVDCTTNPTNLKKNTLNILLFMSDILETESNAVITVKKTFNQFVKFYGF